MQTLCGNFEITRQGHHKARSAEPPAALAGEMIEQLVAERRREMPRLGGLKLHHEIKPDLAAMGVKLGRDRFFDVLRERGLLVEKRRRRARTTNSFHRFRVWPNLIKDLEVTRVDQVWVADITYLRHRGGFAYLSLLTDVGSRKIVGWAVGETLETRWSVEALAMALKGAGGPVAGLIHHSDRGVQYCSDDYVNGLKREKIAISMAETGNPYENALAERVNGILKDEFLLDRTMEDAAQARRAAREAIRTYNERRPHRSIGLMKPAEKYRQPRPPEEQAA